MRDVAFLNDCLVDGEAPGTTQKRSVRQRALASALLFEAAIISGLVLWPLLTPATLPSELPVVARLPLRGEVIPRAPHPPAPRSHMQTPNTTALFSPLRVPAQIVRAATATAQNVAPPPIGDSSGQMLGEVALYDGFANGAAPLVPPAPAAPKVRVIQRSEGFLEGRLVTRVIPMYPAIARAARISGTVELLVLVGRDGRVISVQVLSGSALLASAAKEAVERWSYRPAILDGQAVEVEARVTVNFVLNE
jgi:periplasmic protein TonB